MSRFNLGIIGRCTSLQPWTHPKELYHRQLRSLLKERDGIYLDINLAANHYLAPHERLHILYKKIPLDGLLYHMRFLPKHPLLQTRRDASGKLHYSFNPLFHSRNSYSYQEIPIINSALVRRSEDLHQQLPIQIPFRTFFGIRPREINFLAGTLCRLNSWVIKNEWFFIDKLRTLCIELKIPLFILGPIPKVEYNKREEPFLVSNPKRKWVESRLTKLKIPHYVLHDLYDKEGMPLHKPSRMHLSVAGHAFLAKELYPIITPWIQSILASKNNRTASTPETYTQPELADNFSWRK